MTNREDQDIVATADRWESAKLEESRRRFDSILGALGVMAKTLLALSFLVGVPGLIYVNCSVNAAEDRAHEARRTSVYEACLEQGLGSTCTCLIDGGTCQREAVNECREKLPEETCLCLLDGRTCARTPYETCLKTMSAAECSCLDDVDLCE